MTWLKAPFVYFGGKSAVAGLVWARLGDCDNVIEPFCGSAAFLLARPHPPRVETINDLDCYVANFWRATQQAPEAVAEHADWPVQECDLQARHRWLVLSEEAKAFRERMRTDPDYYDAKIAGWWCWGLCCWIGAGWCSTPETAEWNQTPPSASGLTGVHSAGPATQGRRLVIANPGSDAGKGVHGRVKGLRQKRPKADGERGGLPGVHGEARPQLADAYARGRGVHGNDDAGTCAQRRAWLLDWFGRLRDRLRTVRVCCGHWLRVCDSKSVTTRLGVTGVFLDAPYRTKLKDGSQNRSDGLYATDCANVNPLVDEVIAWCQGRGNDSMMRIAACCYEGEGYEVLLKQGWTVESWRAQGGYGNRSEKGKKNRERERLFFSPHCERGRGLFDGIPDA